MPRRYKRSRIAPIQLEKKTVTTILGFSAVAFSLLLFLSFFTNAGALLSLKETFYDLFGFTVIFVPILLIAASLPLLSIKIKFLKVNTIFGSLSALLSFSALVSLASQNLGGTFGTTIWQVFKSLLTSPGAF